MAIHALGKGEQQVQFLLGAPILAFSSMDRILGFELRDGSSILSGPAKHKYKQYHKGD